jgi:hypothetical protein
MRSAQMRCEWLSLRTAMQAFVAPTASHQSGRHIKPLHWYVACRLVVEGGFRPEDVTPRPPFAVSGPPDRPSLEYNEDMGEGRERTVLGGLKTKTVDVVVAKEELGPAMAVSVKGALGAFRNLTNRMEEAVGDCTNLHISYPAMVYGFLQVIRETREADGVDANDVAVQAGGAVADLISRYHGVLTRLAGREDIREDPSRYGAVALLIAEAQPPRVGEVLTSFPATDSPLSFDRFFETLYEQYDQRFVFAAPSLERKTRRLEWAPDSPALTGRRVTGYAARLGA